MQRPYTDLFDGAFLDNLDNENDAATREIFGELEGFDVVSEKNPAEKNEIPDKSAAPSEKNNTSKYNESSLPFGYLHHFKLNTAPAADDTPRTRKRKRKAAVLNELQENELIANLPAISRCYQMNVTITYDEYILLREASFTFFKRAGIESVHDKGNGLYVMIIDNFEKYVELKNAYTFPLPVPSPEKSIVNNAPIAVQLIDPGPPPAYVPPSLEFLNTFYHPDFIKNSSVMRMRVPPSQPLQPKAVPVKETQKTEDKSYLALTNTFSASPMESNSSPHRGLMKILEDFLANKYSKISDLPANVRSWIYGEKVEFNGNIWQISPTELQDLSETILRLHRPELFKALWRKFSPFSNSIFKMEDQRLYTLLGSILEFYCYYAEATDIFENTAFKGRGTFKDWLYSGNEDKLKALFKLALRHSNTKILVDIWKNNKCIKDTYLNCNDRVTQLLILKDLMNFPISIVAELTKRNGKFHSWISQITRPVLEELILTYGRARYLRVEKLARVFDLVKDPSFYAGLLNKINYKNGTYPILFYNLVNARITQPLTIIRPAI